MNYLRPTSVRIIPQRSVVGLFLALAVIGLFCLGERKNTVAVVGLFGAMMGMGWIAAATIITQVCGGYGLVLKPPQMTADFHALSGFQVQAYLGNLNRSRPALFITAQLETITEGIELRSPTIFLAQLEPRGRAPLGWAITVRKRGECRVQGVRVTASFPGSLAAHECYFPFSEKLLALPAVYRLHHRPLDLLSGRRRAASRTSTTAASAEDFIGVRDYRPGDNPRNIHMGLSVRMPNFPHELVVREFEDPAMDDICVVLDTAIPAAETDDVLLNYRHEKSLCFAIALCRLLSERQYFVRFRAVDQTGSIDVTIARPTQDLPRLEALLARLRPIRDQQPVRLLLDQVSTRGNDAIIFMALRDRSPRERQRTRAVLTIPPDLQSSLVHEVVGI